MSKRNHSGIEWEGHYEAQRAHKAVFDAMKSGKLIRPWICDRCEFVDRVKREAWENSLINAHHSDYAKPLDVIWLCSPCHHEEHKRMKKAGETAWNFYHLQNIKDPNSFPLAS